METLSALGTLGGYAGIVWLIFMAICILVAIAWIILPFALIGTKPILRELLAEAKKTNALLEQRRIS
jgi:heme exporter protein D